MIARFPSKTEGVYLYPILPKKKFDNTNKWYDDELRKIPALTESYAANRDYGIFTAFPELKRKLTKAIETTAPAPLSSATEWSVSDLNANCTSGNISFISGGKAYAASFTIDPDWKLNHESIASSLKEDTAVADNNALIEKNNTEILNYKKDKRRAKYVKEYEKRVKKLLPFNSDFTTFEQFNKIVEHQENIVKIQNNFLQELR